MYPTQLHADIGDKSQNLTQSVRNIMKLDRQTDISTRVINNLLQDGVLAPLDIDLHV
jgi:hypothetical protein